MTSTELARDDEARRAVVDDLDRTLFLEAGAGSGKTSCLVDRFVALVESGVAADHIAAITFTEKAAGELVDRIRGELEHRAREGSASCGDALAVLDRAAIGTLHSFAQRILTEHPDRGRPPASHHGRSTRSRRRSRSRSDGTNTSTRCSTIPRWSSRCGCCSPAAASSITSTTSPSRSMRTGTLSPTASTGSLRRCRPSTCRGCSTKLEEVIALADHCTSTTDKLLAHINGTVQEFAQRLREAVDDDTRLELLTAAKLVCSYGTEEQLAEHRHRRRQGTARRPAGRLRGAAPQRSGGGAAGARIVAGGLHRPRRRGPPARRVSSSSTTSSCSPAPCCAMPTRVPLCALRSRRATSGCSSTSSRTPTRSRSSSRSSSRRDDPAAGQKDWWTVAIEPGRLFFVGDPKQSIYRFRRADIGMFLKARDELVGSSEALTQNFRTGRPIRRVGQRDVRVAHPGSPRFAACLSAAAAGARRARRWPARGVRRHGARREAQSRCAAGGRGRRRRRRTIRRAVRERWSVGERGPDGSDTWRSARWSDIAVLLPARTSLPFLERALEAAEIPYRAETSIAGLRDARGARAHARRSRRR